MRHNKYSLIVLLAALAGGCGGPARKTPQAAAAPARTETVVTISAEDEKKVEGLYYRAVGAYSNNDMDATRKYLDDISALYPSYPPAEELRGKIKGVAGSPR